MKRTRILSFEQLRRRYNACASNFDAPAGEAFRIMSHLLERRSMLESVDDLLEAIQSSSDEELAAFGCREGVAVSHSSDGWWLLLSFDDCLSNYCHETLSTLSVAECGQC